jgi:hypothetical protein
MKTNLVISENNGFIVGDSFELAVTVLAVPTTVTITKAWWTLKVLLADADPGAMQLVIDATPATSGAILDDGSVSGNGILSFTAGTADTTALTAGTAYLFDFQLKYDDDSIHTIGKGVATPGAGVTDATT